MSKLLYRCIGHKNNTLNVSKAFAKHGQVHSLRRAEFEHHGSWTRTERHLTGWLLNATATWLHTASKNTKESNQHLFEPTSTKTINHRFTAIGSPLVSSPGAQISITWYEKHKIWAQEHWTKNNGFVLPQQKPWVPSTLNAFS